jgi:hypothetical protein
MKRPEGMFSRYKEDPMGKSVSRREIMRLGAIGGTSLFGGAILGCKSNAFSNQRVKGLWPWPLNASINPDEAASLAYKNFYIRGCMYGVFTGIAAGAAERLGEPYNSFPFEMMHYGAGGGELWGSLCGALNGGLAAFAVFVGNTPLRRTMASQLIAWYENTALPAWDPKTPSRSVPKRLPRSKANSPLCHISIGRWVSESGYDSSSPECLDRCARLTASVAQFIARQLNEALLKGSLQKKIEISEDSAACLSCHGREEGITQGPEILSRMNCTPCHDVEIDRRIIPHPKK